MGGPEAEQVLRGGAAKEWNARLRQSKDAHDKAVGKICQSANQFADVQGCQKH